MRCIWNWSGWLGSRVIRTPRQERRLISVFYFDLMVGEQSGRDEVGIPAADLEGALREAIQRGRIALAIADDNGQDWRAAMLVVRDADRSIVCAFRLSTLLRAGPVFSHALQ